MRATALPSACSLQGLPPSERMLEPPQAAGLEMAASCPPPVLLPLAAPVPGSSPQQAPSACTGGALLPLTCAGLHCRGVGVRTTS